VSLCRPWESALSWRTVGFVKLLAALQTGEILGAQIVGPEADELIHELIA